MTDSFQLRSMCAFLALIFVWFVDNVNATIPPPSQPISQFPWWKWVNLCYGFLVWILCLIALAAVLLIVFKKCILDPIIVRYEKHKEAANR